MHKTLLLQAVLSALVAILALGFKGRSAAISVLLGSMAYILPNLLFIVRLKFAAASGRANAMTFFFGEFGKIAVTIGILVATQRYYADLSWIWLLVGLFVALKSNLFGFLFKT